MSFFAKRLIAALLLAVYASASVLSSAFHDHQHGACCESTGHVAEAKDSGHRHSCRHHHHGHAHAEHAHEGHSHAGHSHAEHGKSSNVPQPLHDDHCSSCHFLGLASVATPHVALSDGGDVVSPVAAPQPVAPISTIAQLWRSRGPPSQG